MRRLTITVALAALMLAGGARAESLADIRSQLDALGAEFSDLRRELVGTGALAQRGGGDLLQRLEVIEAELMRLTGRTEELELRINRVVTDGTNRLGDLEFRLTELEGGDSAALQPARPLGADVPPPVAPPATPTFAGDAGEAAELDRAREVLGQGDFRRAEALLATHAATWPDSPLRAEVAYLRATAQEGLAETAAAARSYLDSFSADPEGARAPAALFRLGRALARLEQYDQACQILAEAQTRYPDDPAAQDAAAEARALNCP